MTVQLRYGAATDIGLVRELNEDSMLQKPPLFVVADGMGGHSAGDVASKMAVDSLASLANGEEGLTAAVKRANRRIYETARKDSGLGGMGTTLTAMLAGESSFQIAHVGDSRAYLLRDGELTRITQDHTVVSRLVQEGRITEEDAQHHPQRSYLERALGVEDDVDVDVSILDAHPGDRLLLCSDGLYTMVSDEQIAEVLAAEDEPTQAANSLCRMAVEAGGSDNVTAMVIDYPGPRPRAAAPARPVKTKKKLIPRWVAALVVAAVVALVAGLMGKAALDESWYVGIHDGKVTVFNGVKGSFAGIDLSEPSTVSGLEAETLPEPEQSRLEEGIPASDRTEAERIVENLRRITASQAAPSPSPSATGSP